MTEAVPSPTIHLMRTCPFCLRLRIFLSEAGLENRFTLAAFDQGSDEHHALRARMEAAGTQPSFPAAEFAPGEWTTGTDGLIARFAGDAGVDPASMPLLDYYSSGVFKQYIQMFRELKELKSAPAA